MKRHLKIKILFMLLATLLTSCDGWLDLNPEDEQTADEYWTTKEEVESVLASGYVYLRDAVVPQLIELGELRAGCIYNTDGSDLQTFQLTADDEDECSWETLYEVINMANNVLTYGPDVQEVDETFETSVLNSYLVEAYFLRALAYFYIVRNWEEAPLVTEPSTGDDWAQAASSQDEIIAQIKSDILAALGTGAAKEKYSDDWATKGRATKWSLDALMADVCLWNEDYSTALTYCNAIINSTSDNRPAFVTASSKWFELFYPGNSNGSIFEIQWDDGEDQTNTLPTLFGDDSPTYEYTDQMLQDFTEETEETGVDDAVRTIYGGYLPDVDADEYETATIGYVWKYTGIGEEEQSRASDEYDPNYIVYRMADVMLMKSEALVMNSSDTTDWRSAVILINKIRTRANLDTITPALDEVDEEDMLEYILDERKMEFAGEGKRWYDLLRFGKRNNFEYRDDFLINQVTEYNNTANSSWIRSVLNDDDALYLPIYSDEIESNTLLEQNPYYE